MTALSPLGADLIERGIFQMSWVVPDLEAAVKHWVETVGVGPFYIMPHIPIPDLTYRGQPANVDFSMALAQAGPLQVELVMQHNDVPSCYRDTVAKGETKLHHKAIIVPDYDATVAKYTRAGFAIAQAGRLGELRFCYIDTSPILGTMMEIVEDKPSIRKTFAVVADAAQGWDGVTDPVRRFG